MEWFESLQEREKRVLLGGSIIAVIVLLYSFVIDPVYAGHRVAADDVQRKSQLLTEAQRRLPVGGDAGPSGEPVSPTQSLTLLVANTVDAAGLSQAYKSSSPTTDNGLRVSLENASFDVLVAWLAQLESAHQVTVIAGSFTRRPEQGRVDVSIVLRR